MKVRDLMSTEIFFLRPDHSLDLVNDVMNWHHVRHIPVVDDQRKLVGLITHRDLLRASVSSLAKLSEDEQSRLLKEIPAKSIMKKEIVHTTPATDLRDAAAIMIDEKIGCLPVVENDKLVGILTEADFLTLAWDVMGREAKDSDFASAAKYSKPRKVKSVGA